MQKDMSPHLKNTRTAKKEGGLVDVPSKCQLRIARIRNRLASNARASNKIAFATNA